MPKSKKQQGRSRNNRNDRLPGIQAPAATPRKGRINGVSVNADQITRLLHRGGKGGCPPAHKQAIAQILNPENFPATSVVIRPFTRKFSNTGADTWSTSDFDYTPKGGMLYQGNSVFSITADTAGEWWVAVAASGQPWDSRKGYIYENLATGTQGGEITPTNALAVGTGLRGYPEYAFPYANGPSASNLRNVAITLGVRLTVKAQSASVEKQGGSIVAGQYYGDPTVNKGYASGPESFGNLEKYVSFDTYDGTVFNRNVILNAIPPTIPTASPTALLNNTAGLGGGDRPGGWLIMMGTGFYPGTTLRIEMDQAHLFVGQDLEAVCQVMFNSAVAECALACVMGATPDSSTVGYQAAPNQKSKIQDKAEVIAGKTQPSIWSGDMFKAVLSAVPAVVKMLA